MNPNQPRKKMAPIIFFPGHQLLWDWVANMLRGSHLRKLFGVAFAFACWGRKIWNPLSSKTMTTGQVFPIPSFMNMHV